MVFLASTPTPRQDRQTTRMRAIQRGIDIRLLAEFVQTTRACVVLLRLWL